MFLIKKIMSRSRTAVRAIWKHGCKDDLVGGYLKFYSLLWISSYTVFIILTEYLKRDDQIRLLSFYSQDGPGNVDPTCIPKPIGVHYFGDLVSAVCHSRLSAPYLSPFATNYFPLTYFIMKPFNFVMGIGLPVLMLTVLIISLTTIVLPIYLRIRVNNAGSAITFCCIAVFLSQPFLSILDRGNIQFLVAGFVISGLLLIDRRQTSVSPLLIGLGAALKGYPIVFALVFLRRREWRRFAIAISTAITSNTLALILFPGGLSANFRALIRQLRPFTEVETQWLRYNVSFKAFLLSVVEKNQGVIGDIAKFLNSNYQFLLIITSVAIVAMLLDRKIEIFHFLILCSIFSSALIDLSATYSLTLFFTCFLVIDQIDRKKLINRILLVCLALIMVPKGISVSQGGSDQGASLVSFMNPSLMLIMLLGVIVDRFNRLKPLLFDGSD
jgi:hypothetical protein